MEYKIYLIIIKQLFVLFRISFLFLIQKHDVVPIFKLSALVSQASLQALAN